MKYLLLFLLAFQTASAEVFVTRSGMVTFESNATLENIRARSERLRGLIKTDKTFAFAIRLNSFDGFNSPLQMEHFNENYVESSKYEEAVFKGKIVEEIAWNKKGKLSVRAKGEFTLHGITKIETILSTIELDGNSIKIEASFVLKLSDYDIKIPRLVHKKLSENIQIHVDALLLKTGS